MKKVAKKYLIYDYIYKDLKKKEYNNSEAINRLLFLGMQRERIQKRYAELEVWLDKVTFRLETLETANINLTDTLNFLFDDSTFLTQEEKKIIENEVQEYKIENIDKIISEQEQKNVEGILKLKELKKLKENKNA